MNKQTRYEVQTYFFGDSWENCWTDTESGKPLTFASMKDARQELADYLRDRREAYFCGDMIDKPSLSDHRIVEV